MGERGHTHSGAGSGERGQGPSPGSARRWPAHGSSRFWGRPPQAESVCSGSCSRSPKWPDSAGRETVSDMNYSRGSGNTRNNECERRTAVGRSNTGSPRAGLRPPAAPLSPASGRWGRTHRRGTHTPAITRTRGSNAHAAFTSPGIKFRARNDPCIHYPSSNLDFEGKSPHIRAPTFYNG